MCAWRVHVMTETFNLSRITQVVVIVVVVIVVIIIVFCSSLEVWR